MNTLLKIAAVSLPLMLGACATNSGKGGAGPGGHTQNTEGYGVDGGAQFAGLTSNEKRLMNKQVYLFDYDSFSLKTEEDRASVLAHAKYLRNNPNAKVLIEGHTDERGSREYNIALGERRANSVVNLLQVEGVSPNQIEIVSYGEEKPAKPGHGEDSWAQNRRSLIVYENRS